MGEGDEKPLRRLEMKVVMVSQYVRWGWTGACVTEVELMVSLWRWVTAYVRFQRRSGGEMSGCWASRVDIASKDC